MALFEKRTIVKNEIDYEKLAKAISKENHTEIDYDKLAGAISKGIAQNKSDEEKAREAEEKQHQSAWRKELGLRKLNEQDSLLQKCATSFINTLRLLKAFVFYKKSYAKQTRMSFAFMVMICIFVFFCFEIAFLLLTVALVCCMCIGQVPMYYLPFPLITLFFAKFMKIIRLEIDQMENGELINMIFSSLMAFIAALFTVLAFIKGVNGNA